MSKIIIAIIIIIVIAALGYWIYQSIIPPKEEAVSEGSKDCVNDDDCIVFGETGDCNCGCYNKSNLPTETGGECFCLAPNSCKCVDSKCEGVFKEEVTTEEKGTPEEQEEKEVALEEEEGEIPKEEEKKDEGPREVSNTTRKGTVFEDEIWKGEIHIIGDIIVEEGVTLIIEPGTRVLIAANQDVENLSDLPFDIQQGIREEHPDEDPYYRGVHFGEPFRDEGNHISIYIHGTLHAVGTPEQMITITSDSPTPGIYDWNYFNFDKGILSYCVMEYYRCFNPGDNTVVSHNILRHVGECTICLFSGQSALVEYNSISYAGHELIGMKDSSPTIRNNDLGPNPNLCGIVIDGGSPLITGNTIKDCGRGIPILVPPKDPNFKDNILKNNTFLNNGQNVSYGY